MRSQIVLRIVAGVLVACCAVSVGEVSPVSAATVTARSSMDFDEALSDQEQNVYLPPDTIAVMQLSAPSGVQYGDSDLWYRGLYYYAITNLGFADMPFNYVVTWQGDMYEGKSGGLDVAPLVSSDLSGELGSAVLVAYFGNNQEMTNAGKTGLRDVLALILTARGFGRQSVVAVDGSLAPKTEDVQLSSLVLKPSEDQAWIGAVSTAAQTAQIDPAGGSGALTGSVQQVDYEETVDAAQNFVVTAEIRNEGILPWYNSGEYATYVSTSAPRNRESALFVTDKWASFARVVAAEEQWVLSGETATFIFEIQTPLIPGEYAEKFELVQLPDTWIEGTQFEVRFTVNKGDFKLLQVKETETGYLNVRQCAAFNCKEVGKAASGEVLIWTELKDAWYKVTMSDGKTGWLYSRYVKEL